MASMRIASYEFGHIHVAGKDYDADVIVTADGVRDHWRRETGHVLHVEDLDPILATHPGTLVIGTGYYGRMTVPRQTRAFLEANGIEVRAAKTPQAVEIFNRLQRDCADVVAALHLTC